MFLKMANECAKREGASSTDVDELVAHKPASGMFIKSVIIHHLKNALNFSIQL